MDQFPEFYRYHAWAMLQLLDSCDSQPLEALQKMVVGTDRSILHTLTHIVGSEQAYLKRVTGEPAADPVEAGQILAIPELRQRFLRLPTRWEATLGRLAQIDVTLPAVEDYPETPHVQNLIVLQTIQHGIDHRTQICTTLTTLCLQPPQIDVWDYWVAAHPPQG